MFDLHTTLVGMLLVFIQVLAAVPWLLALAGVELEWRQIGRAVVSNRHRTTVLILLASIIIVPILFNGAVQGPTLLEGWGNAYAIVLQLQLLVDFFVIAFALLLRRADKLPASVHPEQVQYGIAIGIGALALGARLALHWAGADHLAFLPCILAIVVSGWYCGYTLAVLTGLVYLGAVLISHGLFAIMGAPFGDFRLEVVPDLLLLAVVAMLAALGPNGGAVALAAFRESIRQPSFWLLTLLAFFFLLAGVFVPYFTFGEDALMYRDIGNDFVMLFAGLFAVFAASLSVSEEIEGRTTLTVMSKPVSRRQFLLGKFSGILLAALVMYALLGTWFEGMVLFHRWWTYRFELPDPKPVPQWLSSALTAWDLPSQSSELLKGAGMWLQHGFDTVPALLLSFSEVAVLLGLAVALASRVPMFVNLLIVLPFFVLANLTPILVTIAKNAERGDKGMVSKLLGFVARAFDTVLPDLGGFRLNPALLGDTLPPAADYAKYIAEVSLYGVLYTGIVLLFGLILFEDKDLA
jgi:hypothetical protein